MSARAHLHITGRVQGVFFRATCRQEAERRNLRGWVRNLRDGRVEAVGEGAKEDVEAWIDWCRRGPSGAVVTDVESTWEDPRDEPSFTIRADA